MKKLSKREYNTIHQWLKRHYYKSGSCDNCHAETKTQWSNVSGQYKKHDRKDWQEYCIPCHAQYDQKNFGHTYLYRHRVKKIMCIYYYFINEQNRLRTYAWYKD